MFECARWLKLQSRAECVARSQTEQASSVAPWRKKGGKLVLVDDEDQPLKSGSRRYPGDEEPMDLTISKTSVRPYVGDIQAVIPRKVLEEIQRLRTERERYAHEERQRAQRGKIRAFRAAGDR